jgi:hypothetical protein
MTVILLAVVLALLWIMVMLVILVIEVVSNSDNNGRSFTNGRCNIDNDDAII